MMTKEAVLYNAQMYFNRPDIPWQLRVEGDKMIATWKWMDATFFGPGQVTDEDRNFTFVVTLKDNGKWKEKDIINNQSTNANFANGNFSMNKSFTQGHSVGKTITFGVGKQGDNVGVIKSKFDTAMIKEPIRQYLISCGWKKAGLF